MTIDGRDSNSNRDKRNGAQKPDSRSGHVLSGAFRTSNGGRGWAQRQRPEDWTVAEQFIREGFYYRLLRRPIGAKSLQPRLTRRENDVLRLACAGQNNKNIAVELQVSASTVGVLLFRAAAKLNVTSRSDLLSAYKRFVTSSHPGDASGTSPGEPDP